jgi:site-specific recombinase XerD
VPARTQRAYRRDLFNLIRYAGIARPPQTPALFVITVAQIHAYHARLIARGGGPKTIIGRITSLSGFFRFLHKVAAELRLPIQIANPAGTRFADMARRSSE